MGVIPPFPHPLIELRALAGVGGFAGDEAARTLARALKESGRCGAVFFVIPKRVGRGKWARADAGVLVCDKLGTHAGFNHGATCPGTGRRTQWPGG